MSTATLLARRSGHRFADRSDAKRVATSTTSSTAVYEREKAHAQPLVRRDFDVI